MALSRATVLLLLLPCPAVVALSVTLGDVSASQECLSSPEAVRQEYPGAWPSWTMQAASHKGTRCWYPGTRENHVHHVETPTPKRTVEHRRIEPDIRNDAPDEASLASTNELASANEMNALGWSFRNRTTRIGPATMFDDDAMAESSFEDRFAAAFEINSISQPSVIQRMMDPIGAIP
jgi:hypothetical protein